MSGKPYSKEAYAMLPTQAHFGQAQEFIRADMAIYSDQLENVASDSS